MLKGFKYCVNGYNVNCFNSAMRIADEIALENRNIKVHVINNNHEILYTVEYGTDHNRRIANV